MRIDNRIIASTALAFASAVGVAGTASAQAGEAPLIKDGPHVIVVHRLGETPQADSRVAGCMIVSNNGRNVIPSLYTWNVAPGPGAWCGLSGNAQDVMANGQAVWQVHSIRASNGAHAYVVRSHVNGRCLIRGRNGHASEPSLHLWTGLGGDPAYCGLRSADELIANGQAAWTFDASPFGWGVLVHSAWTGSGTAKLGFAPPHTYPNLDPYAGFATFTHDASRWAFVFWPTEY